MIVVNKAQCKKCGDIVESLHRHDFKACSCGAIFVDGGLNYIRWGGDSDSIVDLSVTVDEPGTE